MIEHKSSPAHELKLDEQGVIEVAFAQLNVIDHDGDLTLPGAFPAKEVPMSAYGHASWDGALPVGKGSIAEEDGWAVFRGQMFLNTTHGRDAYETLKGLGGLAEFSYGYAVTDSAPGVHEGRNVRVLKGLDPFEVSHVLKGAGIGTHLRSIKSGALEPDAPYAEHLSWLTGQVEAMLERTKARADLRATEGRKLSRSDRASLEVIRDALTTHLETVTALLVVPEPAPAPEEPKSVTLDVLLGIASRMGVPV